MATRNDTQQFTLSLFFTGEPQAVEALFAPTLHKYGFGKLTTANHESSVGGAYGCIQLMLDGNAVDTDQFRNDLSTIALNNGVDACLQTDSERRTKFRLACFDMDSTLINVEVIDELAKYAGVGSQVAEITVRAMRGELDFKQSFAARMALLKGLPETTLAEVAAELPLMEGAKELFAGLRARGIKTAILSGGFTYFAEHLQRELGLDHVHANILETRAGQLTGQAVEPIVDGARKAWLLKEIAQLEGVDLSETIAVGDGANDLPMLGLAGLGVAYHAKPIVQQQAKFALSVPGLEGLLELIQAE